MTNFSRREIAEAFVRKYAAAKTKGQRDKLLSSLAALILDQNKVSEIDLIAREIIEAQGRLSGTLAAEIYYKLEPSDKVLTEIANRLKKLTGAQRVVFDRVSRPDLIGGVIVKTPSAEMDISIRKRLDNFKLRAMSS